MITIRRYVTPEGRDVIGAWLEHLNDNEARARIQARIARMSAGNFGNCKRLRGGISELRVD